MRILLVLLAGISMNMTTAQQPTPYNADANGDNVIGVTDVLFLIGAFGDTIEPASCPFPELTYQNFSNIWLDGANLIGMDFTGSVFINAQLSGAELDYSNLSGALFSQANLGGASCQYANFQGADLSNAQLMNTDFSQANLVDASLFGCIVYDANFTGVDFTGAYLDMIEGLQFAQLVCLEGCPAFLQSGFVCEPDPDCDQADRFRVVTE